MELQNLLWSSHTASNFVNVDTITRIRFHKIFFGLITGMIKITKTLFEDFSHKNFPYVLYIYAHIILIHIYAYIYIYIYIYICVYNFN